LAAEDRHDVDDVTCVMANSVASTDRERVAQVEQLKDLLDH
jgi:hypothetical protein